MVMHEKSALAALGVAEVGAAADNAPLELNAETGAALVDHALCVLDPGNRTISVFPISPDTNESH